MSRWATWALVMVWAAMALTGAALFSGTCWEGEPQFEGPR